MWANKAEPKEESTVQALSFRNCLLKSHFSEILPKYYDLILLLHSKSLKKCHKKFENWFTNKNSIPQSLLEYGYFVFKGGNSKTVKLKGGNSKTIKLKVEQVCGIN